VDTRRGDEDGSQGRQGGFTGRRRKRRRRRRGCVHKFTASTDRMISCERPQRRMSMDGSQKGFTDANLS